ncbi:ribbon-helix-helix domain-containing protein [soil metagenome]
MSHRTQLTLDDDQYARLLELSRQTGMSLSELVRRAIDSAYAGRGLDGLTESFGSWRGRTVDGKEYVERSRTGLAARLGGSSGRSR